MADSDLLERLEWKGPALPIERGLGGYWHSKGTEKLIWSGIVYILGTRIGTRIMQPTFGSAIPELLWEPVDSSIVPLIIRYTTDALYQWEKRINIINVNASFDASSIYITIQYMMKNDPQTMVEGTLALARNSNFNVTGQVIKTSRIG